MLEEGGMRRIVVVASLFYISFLSAFSLKDKLTRGNSGDYVVTEQFGCYTALLIREISDSQLILEEINIPKMLFSSDSWKQWIEEGAPAHTSWIAYTVDLEKNCVIHSYSYSEKSAASNQSSASFFSQILGLSLEKVPLSERKRIGMEPQEGEIDRRSLWLPTIMFEGKKIDKPSSISAWRGRWPNDQSIIANCELEIYFTQFSFPYWIEIKSPHYTATIRSVDSGEGVISPQSIALKNIPSLSR